MFTAMWSTCIQTYSFITLKGSQLATRVILDSKHFVKEWPFRDEADQLLRFICRVMPGLSVLKTELTKELPPSELIIVPLHAILGELNQKWIFHQEN